MNYGFGRLLSKTTIALSVHMVVVVVDDFVDDVDDVDDGREDEDVKVE